MANALFGQTTQAAMLVVGGPPTAVASRTATALLLLAYAPPSARQSEVAQVALMVVLSGEGAVVAETTQVAMLVAFASGIPDPARTRAWTFTLDGHTFYVLNLGLEGTFVYDSVTQQWAQFNTDGFGQWNLQNGVMWGNRIVGGDSVSSQVWELDPTAVLDEGWRDIAHVVTGGVQTRSRVFLSCDAVRLQASVGQIDEENGATLSLRFSDDFGKTWSDYFTLELTEGDFDGELAFRSLGSFMAPGRVFELSDVGGLIRIDGCDGFIDGFDNDSNGQTKE